MRLLCRCRQYGVPTRKQCSRHLAVLSCTLQLDLSSFSGYGSCYKLGVCFHYCLDRPDAAYLDSANGALMRSRLPFENF